MPCLLGELWLVNCCHWIARKKAGRIDISVNEALPVRWAIERPSSFFFKAFIYEYLTTPLGCLETPTSPQERLLLVGTGIAASDSFRLSVSPEHLPAVH